MESNWSIKRHQCCFLAEEISFENVILCGSFYDTVDPVDLCSLPFQCRSSIKSFILPCGAFFSTIYYSAHRLTYIQHKFFCQKSFPKILLSLSVGFENWAVQKVFWNKTIQNIVLTKFHCTFFSTRSNHHWNSFRLSAFLKIKLGPCTAKPLTKLRIKHNDSGKQV